MRCQESTRHSFFVDHRQQQQINMLVVRQSFASDSNNNCMGEVSIDNCEMCHSCNSCIQPWHLGAYGQTANILTIACLYMRYAYPRCSLQRRAASWDRLQPSDTANDTGIPMQSMRTAGSPR